MFLCINQLISFVFKSICFLFLAICSSQFNLQSKCRPRYFTASVWGTMVWLMLTAGQWPFQRVNVTCDDLDSLTLIFHYFSHFSMMCKCSEDQVRLSYGLHELQILMCCLRMCLILFPWMLVIQMCIVYTCSEEDQECSLGVHQNGCGNGLRFLHWNLFRIGVHLGTISGGWNSLRVRFFWFW